MRKKAQEQSAAPALTSSAAIDAAIAELEAALAQLEPELEGLYDYARLNLLPETHEEVLAAISDYERRRQLLVGALDALNALSADGHPDLEVRAIAPEEYADLQANKATIEAALLKFEPLPTAQAASLNPSAAPPEAK